MRKFILSKSALSKSILPFVAVAGIVGFAAGAQAHEPNHSAYGTERAPMTRAADRNHGERRGVALVDPTTTGSISSRQGAPGLSPSDALLFELGDRGLGSN